MWQCAILEVLTLLCKLMIGRVSFLDQFPLLANSVLEITHFVPVLESLTYPIPWTLDHTSKAANYADSGVGTARTQDCGEIELTDAYWKEMGSILHRPFRRVSRTTAKAFALLATLNHRPCDEINVCGKRAVKRNLYLVCTRLKMPLYQIWTRQLIIYDQDGIRSYANDLGLFPPNAIGDPSCDFYRQWM
jgi:hypothetical protein